MIEGGRLEGIESGKGIIHFLLFALYPPETVVNRFY